MSALDPDLLACLDGVLDPEVGLSVVDLGLVYGAVRSREAIEVALSLTTRSCPLGEMIVEEARDRLQEHFPDVPAVNVHLVWDPPWDPGRITDRGLALLGRTPRSPA